MFENNDKLASDVKNLLKSHFLSYSHRMFQLKSTIPYTDLDNIFSHYYTDYNIIILAQLTAAIPYHHLIARRALSHLALTS